MKVFRGALYAILFSLPVWALIIVGALYFSGVAKADPLHHDAALFCRMIDKDPTVQGMLNATMEMSRQGVSSDDAVNTIVVAIRDYCPEYRGLLAAVADRGNHGGYNTAIHGNLGGRVGA